MAERQTNDTLRQRLAQAETERDTARHSANEVENLLNECGVAAGMRAGGNAEVIPEKVRARIALLEEKLDKGVSLLVNGAAETQELVDKILALETRIAFRFLVLLPLVHLYGSIQSNPNGRHAEYRIG